MALFYSVHPIVNNPVLARDQDINGLTFVATIPKVLINGLNLVDKIDYPVINPNEVKTHSLGAGFSNMILQPVFVAKRSKLRGTYRLGVILAGISTEHFIEVTPQGEFTTISLFTDSSIDNITVGNLTEDGVSCNLLYGQGSLVAGPSLSGVSVTNFKDLVNEIIANNGLNASLVENVVKRIVGPTPTP